MNCRRFTLDNQIAFAELSGDYNPLHIDAIASRRLIFGAPVVHGIHALLWSLDCLLEGQTESFEVKSIRAVFPKPIRVDEDVSFSLIEQDDSSYRIQLTVNQSIVTIITVVLDKVINHNYGYLHNSFPEKIESCVLSDNEMENESGSLGLYLNEEVTGGLFPNLMRCFSTLQIATILTTTRVVGSKCPGLHSIYSEISLIKSSSSSTRTTLDYEVTKLDKRVGLVFIKIVSPDMNGVIKAFRRPSPLKQESYLSLKNKVDDNEFSDQRALIIGGSRGLGEVMAKLLAGGGADVKVTYHQGKEDAVSIVDDIVSNGGVAECCQYDVLHVEKKVSNILKNNWVPTHLYYFATPFIFSGAKGKFSPKLFTKFCDYYVLGFVGIVNKLRELGVKNIFYPSTVAIDEIPVDMGEYAATKIASEFICDFLEKSDNDLTIYKPRFPRVSTDQTASIIPVENHDPVPLMIQELRYFIKESKQ